MNKIKLQFMISMFIFGSIAIFTTKVSISSVGIVQYRSLIGFICLIIYGVIKKESIDIEAIKNNLLPLVISGILLGFNWLCLFEAYASLSVGLATIIYYFAPIIVFFVAIVLFKESLNSVKIIGILVAVLGMICIHYENIISFTFSIGFIYASLSAIFYACIMITNKYISNIKGNHSTIVQLGIAFMIMTIYQVLKSGIIIEYVSGTNLLYILVLGVVHTGIAYTLYFYSIQHLPSQNTSMMSYLDPCFALLFSIIYLNESFTSIQILGILCILLGSYIANKKNNDA